MPDFTTFFIVLNNLLVLCVCMAMGFVCRRTNIVNDEINRGLTNLLLKVTLPCNIIVSLQQPFAASQLAEGALVTLITATIFFCGAGIGIVGHKLTKTKVNGIWVYALAFPNIVYMGFPVIQAIFGRDALFYVSFASISFNAIAYSFGIKWITWGSHTKDATLKNILTNVPMLAIFLGLALYTTSITLPSTLSQAFSMTGAMTTPLSMLIIGGLLAKGNPRDIFTDWTLYMLAGVKLIIIPTLTFLALSPWLQNRMLLGIIVVIAAMPSGTNTAIFAERYGADSVLASRVVFVSTVLCVVTIPIISLLL